jgi:hypothetical protein
MEAKLKVCEYHVIGYKYTGRFDSYHVLVGQAFQELQKRLGLIPSRTDTTVALYEPKRGDEHIVGSFYVGCVIREEPTDIPDGSEYIHIKGKYACGSGMIKQMGQIYHIRREDSLFKRRKSLRGR